MSRGEQGMSLKTNVPNNENSEKCSACGGKCCKNNPGAYLPEDFTADQLTKGGMLNLIKNGRISIDGYEDEEFCLHPFLRPRGSLDVCYGGLCGGTCLNLTDIGCRLDFEDRPYECRRLDPKDCLNGGYLLHEPYTKRDIADKWIEYYDIIFEIIDELKLNVGCGRYLGYAKEPKVLAEVKSWLDSYPELDVHGVRYMRNFSQPEIHSEGLTPFLPCEWLQP